MSKSCPQCNKIISFRQLLLYGKNQKFNCRNCEAIIENNNGTQRAVTLFTVVIISFLVSRNNYSSGQIIVLFLLIISILTIIAYMSMNIKIHNRSDISSNENEP